MRYIAVKIDVTDALPQDVTDGALVEIAAWIFPPNPWAAPATPSTITLLNGGTYDKRYFHFEVPGREGYSAAEALAEHGHLVILPDHLGISDSSKLPDQKKATRRIAALANHVAVSEIYRRLKTGTLDPSIPGMPRFVKAGGGHSMGGCQSLAQQAEFETYERLLILGFTAIGVHADVNGERIPMEEVTRGPKDDYIFTQHRDLAKTAAFHWVDLPDDVLEVDDQLSTPVPREIAVASVSMGIASEDASKIKVPVYICLGEKDVSPRPYDEPHYYTSSFDVTLHILPRSGHCQSFASTRMEMIDRIDGWLRSLSA
jgi:pimeloyl-ACP methyl ester carboxylesterase